MFLGERLDREVQSRSRSIGDVNASFDRIKYIRAPLKTRRDPDEWENSYVAARAGWLDRRFWQRQPRGRVTPCNFALGDNCGNVDKMWEGGLAPSQCSTRWRFWRSLRTRPLSVAGTVTAAGSPSLTNRSPGCRSK